MPRNRHAGKLVRRRAYKPGNQCQLLRMVWQALVESESVLLVADDPDVILRAVHALTQAASTYARLLEAADVDARLRAVEATVKAAATRNGTQKIAVA
jgi:hypothetical protein